MEARADTRNNKAAVINSSSGETLWHGTSRERRDRSVCVWNGKKSVIRGNKRGRRVHLRVCNCRLKVEIRFQISSDKLYIG